MSDCGNSILCASFLPHIAHRNWAFAKKEALKYNKDGKLELFGLIGADKLDPGNYKAGEGAIRAIFASAASEFGDEKICADLLKQLDEEYHPVFATKTGSLKNKGLSVISQSSALRARLCKFQDWTTMIQQGPPAHVLRGPILDSVPFPEVLVAKAYSQDGESIDLVFYNGKEAGNFQLGFTRLQPGATYHLAGKSAVADKNGSASFDLAINGRTAVKLEPSKKN